MQGGEDVNPSLSRNETEHNDPAPPSYNLGRGISTNPLPARSKGGYQRGRGSTARGGSASTRGGWGMTGGLSDSFGSRYSVLEEETPSDMTTNVLESSFTVNPQHLEDDNSRSYIPPQRENKFQFAARAIGNNKAQRVITSGEAEHIPVQHTLADVPITKKHVYRKNNSHQNATISGTQKRSQPQNVHPIMSTLATHELTQLPVAVSVSLAGPVVNPPPPDPPNNPAGNLNITQLYSNGVPDRPPEPEGANLLDNLLLETNPTFDLEMDLDDISYAADNDDDVEIVNAEGAT